MKLPVIAERAKKNIIPVRYLVVLIGLAVLIGLGGSFGSALASHVSESGDHGDYVIILVIVGIYVGFLYWAFRKPNPGSSRQRFIGPGGWLIDTQRVAKSGETDPLGEILESDGWNMKLYLAEKIVIGLLVGIVAFFFLLIGLLNIIDPFWAIGW